MEHSKFVFQGNNLCLDSLLRFFLWYVLFFLFSIRIWEVSCFEMLKCWLRAFERETYGDVQTHWLRLNIGISCLKTTLAYRATANRTSYCFNDWTLWFPTLCLQIHCIGKECSYTAVIKLLKFFTVEYLRTDTSRYPRFKTLRQVIWLDLYWILSQSYYSNLF